MTKRNWLSDSRSALLLTGLFVALSVVWIVRDRSVWPWDQAWYGEVSTDLWFAAGRGFEDWVPAMSQALGSKPPLLSWIGQALVPLGLLSNRMEASLLLVNVGAAAATIFLCYIVVRELGASRHDGLLAVLFCGGSALFVGQSTQFFVEALQALIVVLACRSSIRIARQPKAWAACNVVALLCLCLLVKTTTLIFVVPLLGAGLIHALRSRDQPKVAVSSISFAMLITLTLTLLAMTIVWYGINFRKVIQHAVESSSGDSALFYGSAGSLLRKLSFWGHALAQAVSPVPFFFWSIVAMAATTLGTWFFKPQLLAGSLSLFPLSIVATILLGVASYATQINEETRFLTPFIPLLAIVIGWSTAFGGPLLRSVATVAIVANALAVHAIAQGAAVPSQFDVSPWLKAPNSDAHAFDHLQVSVRNSCLPQNSRRYQVVGVELPSFNANSAAFFSAKDQFRTGYRCYYTSLGYAEADPGRAIKRIFDLDADHVLTLNQSRLNGLSDVFNRSSRPVAEWLSSAPSFQKIDEYGDIIVYRRRR